MKAIVLAAGFGTRLQPLTNTTAKPAINFLGIPLIGFPLYQINKVDIGEVVVNTHHLPKTVEAAASLLAPFLNSHISFSHESPKILNSGGAIDKIRKQLESCDHFLLVNADTVINFHHQEGLSRLIKNHLSHKALATLLTCNHPGVGDTIGGVGIDAKNRVVGIGKLRTGAFPNNSEIQLKHYTGYMVLSRKILDFIPSNQPSHIFTDILIPAIQAGESVISHFENLDWYETGNIESFKNAESECKKLLDPTAESNDIRNTVQLFNSETLNCP